VAGCCECGDEPSGSCATELVSYLYYNNCHGNAVKGFWILSITSACSLFGDHLMLRHFGPYRMIFMCCYNCCHGNDVKVFLAL
jgi:hypothetical protein